MRIIRKVSIILALLACSISQAAENNIETKIFNAIKQKDWLLANQLAAKKDIPLKNIVLSQQFLDNNYKGNSFEKIVHFLMNYPSWPQASQMKVVAEGLINDSTDLKSLYKWFKDNQPITGQGYKYYALSAKNIEQDKEKLKSIIKLAWHKGSFSPQEQKQFRSEFGKYLDLQDHITRIDNLLFAESIGTAKNNLHLVPDEYKKSFNAQIALIQNGKKAIGNFKSIPQKYWTPGLAYRYLEVIKSNPPAAATVLKLVNAAKINKANADRFWKLQCYIAREHIENKKYLDAYKIASAHFTSNPANLSEAEFLSGWIALTQLNKPQIALQHFLKFDHSVKTPMSKSRGIYWTARAHESLKQDEQALKLYKLAATRYSYTFYGQVAASEIGQKKIALPETVNLAQYKLSSEVNSPKIVLAKASYYISKYGPNYLAQIYIKTATENASTTSDIKDLAAILSKSSNIHHMAWMGKYAMQKHVLLTNYSFPTPYKNITELPIEKSLTYSVIRQESVFDKSAISSANAIGLMQLIKPTACKTAQSIGDACVISKLTSDPSYNIKLGSNYLNQLIDKFDGSYIMAIAAYNGGKVNKWIPIYGDPRVMKKTRDVINWIESIPYYETRNYVQRVLENLQVYRHILKENDTLAIAQDLLIGNRKLAKR